LELYAVKEEREARSKMIDIDDEESEEKKKKTEEAKTFFFETIKLYKVSFKRLLNLSISYGISADCSKGDVG